MNKPQLEATEKADAVSVAQLCSLTGYSPAYFSAHRDVLGEPFTVPTNSPQGGKPMFMYPLERLAELIIERTGFMSDLELRLAATFSPRRRKSRFYDDHTLFEADGQLHVLPRDHGKLSPELDAKVRAALAADQAALRARRAAKRQPRNTTPEEVPLL